MQAVRRMTRRCAASAFVLLAAACAPTGSGETDPGGSAGAIAADWPAYGSTAAALEASDLAVVATVTASRHAVAYPSGGTGGSAGEDPQSGVAISEDEREAMGVPTTVTTVVVTEVIAGDVPVGATIEVAQPGDSRQDGENAAGHGAHLEDVGSPAVLLLLHDQGDGLYGPVNPDEGVLAVTGEDVSAVPGSTLVPDVRTLQEVRELAR